MSRFTTETRGAVGLMFSILLIPILVIVGAAIDYARINRMHGELMAVADVSAVAAVSDPQNARSADELKQTAESIFRANTGMSASAINVVFDVDVVVDRETSKRTSVVSFKAVLPLTLMQLAGKPSVELTGTATAQSGLPPDTDFFFLLDTSDSMGLAATADARRELIKRSRENGGESCEFACHVPRGGTKTLLAVARDHNLKLRIDVAIDGIRSIVDMAAAAAARDGVVNRYALTAFSNSVTTASTLTSNAEDFKRIAGSLDLGYGVGSALANTLWEKTAPEYLTELDRLALNGKSQNHDRVVVLITDGLRSQDGGGGRDSMGRKLIRPFDLEYCQAIKKKGYKLAVIYTMYYDIPYNAWYKTHVRPIRKDLETTLEACATPGLFAVGDTPDEIDRAFQTIFKSVRSNPFISS